MAESESKTDVQEEIAHKAEIQTKSKTEEMEKESPDNKKAENESDVLREGNQNEASSVVDGQSTDLTQDGMDVVDGPRPVSILTREQIKGITDVIKRCGGFLRGCLDVLLIYVCERKGKNDQTERPDKGNIDTKTDDTIQNATITNATITNATITNATLMTNLPYKVAAIVIGGVVVVAVVYVIRRMRNKDAADSAKSLEKIATHSMASDTEKAKEISAGPENSGDATVDAAVEQSKDLTQDGMDVVEGRRVQPKVIEGVIKICRDILRECLNCLLNHFGERNGKHDQTEMPDKGNGDAKTDGTIQNATITKVTITNATITNITLTTNLQYKVAAIVIGGVVVVAVVYVIRRMRNKDAADSAKSLEKIATHSMASDTEKAKEVSAGPEKSGDATVDAAVELSSSCEFERCLSQRVEIEVLQTEDGPIEIIHIAGSTFSLTSLLKRFGRYIIQKLGVRKDEMPSSSG